jgi:DNA polymerase III epsilon subunit-like protein
MTKERLDTAKFDFEQVRQQVLSFIHEDTILIGHSINNDLYSLKVMTNVIYHSLAN